MTIAELVAKISIKGGNESIKTTKALNINFTQMAKKAMASAAAIGAGVTALYQFTKVAREAAVAMDMYQQFTGLSGQNLQKLSYLAAQSGVGMKELSGTIQSIQQMSKDIALGRGNIAPFQMLGISPDQDPTVILDKVGQKLRALSKTDPGMAMTMARDFGLSEEMYYALLMNETEEMNKQFLLTEKEQKQLVKLNKEWNKVWFYIKQITIKLRGLGVEWQTKFVKLLLRAVQGFGELATRVYDFVLASEKAQKILKVLAVIALAISAYFIEWLAPLLIIGVILEDIFTYFEGGDSVTCAIIDWIKSSETLKSTWETFKDVIMMVIDVLSILWKVVKTSLEGWWMLLKPMIVWFATQFKGVFLEAWKIAKFFLDMLLNGLDVIIKTLIVFFQSGPGQWLAKKLGIQNEINDFTQRYDKYMGERNDFSRPDMTSNGPTANITQNNEVVFKDTGDPMKNAQVAGAYNSAAIKEATYQQSALATG